MLARSVAKSSANGHHALNIAVMICAKHIKALIKATFSLVQVISDIPSDVGIGAIRFDNHAIAIVAEGARAQPGCPVLNKGVPFFAEPQN